MGRQRLAKNRGFPPNLYQNAAGYFYYVNPISGKQRGLKKDRAFAFAEARAANAVLATMRHTPLADWVAGKDSFTIKSWIPAYEKLWSEKAKRAASTLRMCKFYLKRIEESDFAWMRLRDVETVHIAELIRTTEKDSGAATALMLRARLSDLFRMAEAEGHVPSGCNPVTATYAPSRTVKRERLSLEQFWLVHAQAPTWLQRAMMLALLTAQRRDDVAGMKFADFKDGYLHIVQGKGQGDIRMRQDGRIGLKVVGLTIADAIAACRDLIVSRYMVHHTKHVSKVKPGDRVTSNGLSNAFQYAREAAGGRRPASTRLGVLPSGYTASSTGLSSRRRCLATKTHR
jgi:integrase